MKVVLFCHSLISDWNHGNAHFLRGLVGELQAAGHTVTSFEPVDGWSICNLIEESGSTGEEALRAYYPDLHVERYSLPGLDLEAATDGADLVLVHEWTAASVVSGLGRLRKAGARFRLLFHDTHHRSVSDAATLADFDLSSYDGVLAFGESVRERYLAQGWANRVWVFHEAADTRVFRPIPEIERVEDLCFIGNWGDGERTRELSEMLLEPARELGVTGRVHGVRYPKEALEALASSGLSYAGWLPNYRVPEVFARHRLTMHVPRGPYARSLPGIPTIRVFEALACGIPLVSAPWRDTEGLFREGDFMLVRNGEEAKRGMRALLAEPARASEQARRGRETLLHRHTCAHRARELVEIARSVGVEI